MTNAERKTCSTLIKLVSSLKRLLCWEISGPHRSTDKDVAQKEISPTKEVNWAFKFYFLSYTTGCQNGNPLGTNTSDDDFLDCSHLFSILVGVFFSTIMFDSIKRNFLLC